MWTVEWIDGEGSKTVQDNCVESQTLEQLYQALQIEKNNAAKRKQAAQDQAIAASPKRPRVATEVSTVEAEEVIKTSPADELQPAEDTANTASNQSEEGGILLPAATEDKPLEVAKPPQDPPTSIDSDPATAITSSSNPQPSPPLPSFYLLKPATASTKKVLIPLSPRSTLTESLSNRTVLEYPTIYLLSASTTSAPLPPGFMLEDEYLAERQKEEADLGQAVRDAQAKGVQLDAPGGDGKDATTTRQQEAAKNDPQRILEMLRRDLSTAS